MANTQFLLSAVGIVVLVTVAEWLGVARRSHRVSMSEALDAIYVRRGVLTWDLLIAAKDAEVGIAQGRFLLPQARSKAAAVAAGKSAII